MLMRVWKTEFDSTRLAELQRFADEVSGPMLRSLEGCLGFIYAFSGPVWTTTTFWESQEQIHDAESSDVYRDVVERIVDAGFLRGDQTTDVFSVSGLETGDLPKSWDQVP